MQGHESQKRRSSDHAAVDAPRARDVKPTAIRLDPDMKAALTKEAYINGRTLHAELLQRLRTSLDRDGAGHSVASEKRTGYPVMTDSERTLLGLFQRMTPEKQLALLSLLKK